MININTNAMALRTLEPWVSKKEVCKYFNFSTKYLERKYPIFSKGIHFMYKDPSNENGHRVWKISKVEQLLCDNSSGLARRLKRIAWLTQILKKPKNHLSMNPKASRDLTWITQKKFIPSKLTHKSSTHLSTPRLFQVSHSNGSRYLIATS